MRSEKETTDSIQRGTGVAARVPGCTAGVRPCWCCPNGPVVSCHTMHPRVGLYLPCLVICTHTSIPWATAAMSLEGEEREREREGMRYFLASFMGEIRSEGWNHVLPSHPLIG